MTFSSKRSQSKRIHKIGSLGSWYAYDTPEEMFNDMMPKNDIDEAYDLDDEFRPEDDDNADFETDNGGPMSQSTTLELTGRMELIGRLKFVHLRDERRCTKYIGTAALYDRGPGQLIIVSVALLHPGDQFTKRRGRELCALRIFGRLGVDLAMEIGLMPVDHLCTMDDLTECYDYESRECAAVRELFFQLSRHPTSREMAIRLVDGTASDVAWSFDSTESPWPEDEEVTET